MSQHPIFPPPRRASELIIVPTYLEVENIGEFLHRARAALPTADILVVDDNSGDGTADAARAVAKDLGAIEILSRESKGGLGAAYRTGFGHALAAGYDIVFQIDADLSHDPAVLPVLLREVIAGGADLAVGSRYVPGGSIPNWPLYRRALSRYGNRYVGAALRLPVADATSGYRCYRAETLGAISYATTRATGYGFQVELAFRVSKWGGRVTEVPIIFTDRVRGNSKMSFRIIVEAMMLVSWWAVRDRLNGRLASSQVLVPQHRTSSSYSPAP